MAAVRSNAQHEVLVLELFLLEGCGLAAVDAELALRVKPPPCQPATKVIARDRVEAADRVDALHPGPHVEPVIVLVHSLVGVEGLPIAEGPLAAGLLRAFAAGGGSGGGYRVGSLKVDGAEPSIAIGAWQGFDSGKG